MAMIPHRPIHRRQSLSAEVHVGKTGTFKGLWLSSNKPAEITGTIKSILESSWSLLEIEDSQGNIYRIRGDYAAIPEAMAGRSGLERQEDATNVPAIPL